MFELKKTFHFEAGHVLKHHDRKCNKPHGHSYTLVLSIHNEDLIASGPKTNMVVDFGDVSQVVKPMIQEYLDHQWLNETLNTESPTVEFIARWVYRYLKPHLPLLKSVTVCETNTSKASYWET